MYIFGVLFFSTSYLVGKYHFFTWNKKAFGFNAENVALYSVNLMKYALLFHMLMTLFIFTNKRVLTPANYTTDMHFRPKMEPVGEFFARRFDGGHTIIVAFLTIFIVALYLFWKTIVTCFRFIFNIKQRRRTKLQREEHEEHDHEMQHLCGEDEDFSGDIYREMNMVNLRSHYMRAHKEY